VTANVTDTGAVPRAAVSATCHGSANSSAHPVRHSSVHSSAQRSSTQANGASDRSSLADWGSLLPGGWPRTASAAAAAAAATASQAAAVAKVARSDTRRRQDTRDRMRCVLTTLNAIQEDVDLKMPTLSPCASPSKVRGSPQRQEACCSSLDNSLCNSLDGWAELAPHPHNSLGQAHSSSRALTASGNSADSAALDGRGAQQTAPRSIWGGFGNSLADAAQCGAADTGARGSVALPPGFQDTDLEALDQRIERVRRLRNVQVAALEHEALGASAGACAVCDGRRLA
jgi:hypothetical protein